MLHMSEPFKLYVSPVNEKPKWWVLVEDDSASFVGDYEEATHQFPDDETRFAGYRLGYGETSPLWREATRHECLLLVRELSV